MPYQKCPVCNGSGFRCTSMNHNSPCHVCMGIGIIDEKTGKPPIDYKPLVCSSTTDVITSLIELRNKVRTFTVDGDEHLYYHTGKQNTATKKS